MSLAEDIKAYRKSKGHSMNEVSQITGIPADRIYKWEKGTKPNDAEDLLKIKAYLEGKLESDPLSKLESRQKTVADREDFTPSQLYAMFMRVTEMQTGILVSIENKMAREDTQAKIESSLADVRQVVDKLSEAQNKAINRFLEEFAELQKDKAPSRAISRKKTDNGAGG